MNSETSCEPMVGLDVVRAVLRRACGGERSPVPRESRLAAVHEELASRAGEVLSPHDDVLLEVEDDAGLISFVANPGGEPGIDTWV